jgi:hypothetical protein
VRKTAFILLIVLVPAMTWAQAQAAGQSNPSEHPQQNPAAQGNSTSATPPDNGAASSSGQNPDQDQKKEQSEPGQTKRMMYVVPNFAAVSANTELPPLSARGKFVLAWHDSFDYSSFVWTGIVAAQSYGLDSDPELGSGIAGYGRYYWRAFVDGVSGTYFTEAIVPAISHEDPRYYTMGRGGGGYLRRLGYALSRAVLTKTDSGGTSFNWSEVGGNALEAALSNAYYPPQERGASQTATNWATQMESAALNNIAKEFWPDFRRKVLRQK